MRAYLLKADPEQFIRWRERAKLRGISLAAFLRHAADAQEASGPEPVATITITSAPAGTTAVAGSVGSKVISDAPVVDPPKPGGIRSGRVTVESQRRRTLRKGSGEVIPIRPSANGCTADAARGTTCKICGKVHPL